MAQSLTYEIIKNELESYEKKLNTFSKLISSYVENISNGNRIFCDISSEEADELMNIIYRLMGETEPDLTQKLLEIWSLTKNNN
ncbi:MAG: hypothetical protein IJ809_04250 [Clostridia bacterium]|nr:hypothetical protein [Clostridia bacterium]